MSLFTAGMALADAASHEEFARPLSKTPYYLTTEAMESLHAGPPAALGSAQDQADIKALKAAQQTRTKVDCDRAAAEAVPRTSAYQEFFGAIGPLSTPLKGEAGEFIAHVWSDATLVTEKFKKKYKWPRAYDTDSTLQPCLQKTTTAAFPSGHTLVSRVFALVLSSINPKQRNLYLSRADEIAHDRVLAGMHRPSELDAGKALANQVYERLLKSPSFRRDLAKVKVLVAEQKP